MKNDNLPPQNLEAEEAILGGILVDPNAIILVINVLPVEAFYLQAHQVIYQAAVELYKKQQPTDLMTVTTWLKDKKLFTKAGGDLKLAQLVDKTVSAVNIDKYATFVVDKHQRRQLISCSLLLQELAHDTNQEIESVFEKAEEKIFNLTVNKQDPFKPKIIGDCLADIFTKLEQGNTPGYSTGLLDLDRLTGGLYKKDLIVIAARASMGKTWLGCYLANYIATQYNQPVVFFSAEMSNEQLAKRFLAMHSGIDSARLMQNKVYSDEYDSLVKAVGVLAELPIIIDETPASIQTPSRIRSVLRRIKAEKGNIGLVVMDYIQKLGDRAAGNRAQAVGKFSGAFKDIAKEFDVPFIALAQINRGVESQNNKRPSMADIKDSGDIEQDMDIGLLLYRDEYYNPDTEDLGVMEINVAKNRNGSTGVVKVLFKATVGSVLNLA